MDRLDALAAFVAVAERRSFAAAARDLRASPAAVTRAVASVETRLGVRLLHRTTRSVRLTEAGAAFLDRARAVLADLRDAERAVTGEGDEPAGTLTVTAPVVFGRLHVLPVIGALLRRHPRLDARLMLVDRVVRLEEEGVDAAFRIGAPADSALTAVRLGEVRRLLVASPAHLDAVGEPATMADLRRHAVIAITGLDATDAWGTADPRRRAVVAPRLTVNSVEAGIAAALDGLGIARVLSYQVREEVAAGRLRVVLPGETPAPLPVTLLFPAGRSRLSAIRALVEEARSRARREAWG